MIIDLILCLTCLMMCIFAFLWRSACIERDVYKDSLMTHIEKVAVYYSVLTWAGIDAEYYLKKYQEWKETKK
jgi:hypothetical protein